MDCLIALVIVFAAGGALFALLRRAQQQRWRCPNCGSRQVGLIAKEPQGLRSVDMHTGGVGGGYSGIQTLYTVTYQCNDCNFQWKENISETT